MLRQLKTTVRFLGGLVVGVAGSGTVAGWLFALFEWLNVQMHPTTGSLRAEAWLAVLATWAALGFTGQTLAANVAQVAAVNWFVAAINAAILLFAYSVEPHAILLAGAALGFVVAFLLKDSDLLRVGRTLRSRG